LHTFASQSSPFLYNKLGFFLDHLTNHFLKHTALLLQQIDLLLSFKYLFLIDFPQILKLALKFVVKMTVELTPGTLPFEIDPHERHIELRIPYFPPNIFLIILTINHDIFLNALPVSLHTL
jgi:hypothetical protein